MRPRLVFTSAAVLLGLVSAASVARAEWVLGAYLGGATTSSSSLQIAQPSLATALTLDPVSWNGESLTPPIYYGYRLSRFLDRAPWLGVEAEFIHLKVYAKAHELARVSGTWQGRAVSGERRINEFVQDFSISHGVNLLLANGVARLPVGGGSSSRLWVTARAGIGPTIPHAESRIGNVASPQRYAFGRVGVQLGAGLEARLSRHLVALGEFKLTRTRQQVDVTNGTAATRVLSQHLVGGLGWRF